MLFFLASSCSEENYSLAPLIAPNNVVLNAEIVGQDATHPNGNGSGEVNFSIAGDNVLSYKIDYGTASKESFDIFTKENRPELAVREKEEMDIITTYLPAQMSDDELKNIVQATIAETGATSIKDMGKVIGSVSKKVAGKAEGSRISSLVKELLGA